MRIATDAILVQYTPKQLVDHARRLFLLGFPQMAAVAARSAIDTRLWELLASHPVAFRSRKPTIGERALALKRAGVFTLATRKELSRLASLGGLAAHNEPMDLSEVLELIHGAAAFVDAHPTFEEQRGLAMG